MAILTEWIEPSEGVTVKTDTSQDSQCVQSFLKAFWGKYGRAPRILHLGNIANNAYINARLLNEYGFDCDVLCYDYYHIMGCPEWDDVDFKGEIKDQFFPDWWSVDLKGYKRPKWFVQGPLKHCVKYLKAKRKNKLLAASYFWWVLEYKRFMLCSSPIKGIKNGLTHEEWKVLKRIQHYSIKTVKSVSVISDMIMLFLSVSGFCLKLPGLIFRLVFRNKSKLVEGQTHASQVQEPTKEKKYHSNQWLKEHFGRLETEFKQLFPEHKHALSADDILIHKERLSKFEAIFQYYDIIHAYSTDPVFPMLVGNRPYVAFEHGTIREIPFENTSIGKLSLMAYAKADAIIVTNADNLDKARYIQPNDMKVIHGYHRFDERQILNKLDRLKDIPRQTGRFGFDDTVKIFFAPARQSHEIKGNHKIIEAVSLLSRENFNCFKVVFADWGPDVEKAKELIKDYGITSYIHWVSPLGAKDLISTYRSVDCVFDQFVLPCIGGVPIDVMVIGECPVITYLGDELMKNFYGETIPLFNCFSVEEIASAMKVIVMQPDVAAKRAKASQDWMEKYHSHRNVLQKLVEAYAQTNVLQKVPYKL